jgi:hypothetical protein
LLTQVLLKYEDHKKQEGILNISRQPRSRERGCLRSFEGLTLPNTFLYPVPWKPNKMKTVLASMWTQKFFPRMLTEVLKALLTGDLVRLLAAAFSSNLRLGKLQGSNYFY